MDLQCIFMFSYIFTRQLVGSLTATGCYGNTAKDFLFLNCKDNSLITLKQVYAMTKSLSTGCPQENTPGSPNIEQQCCTFGANDCKMNYGPVDLYNKCLGRSNCQVKVSWQDTTCSKSDYLPRSNYMLIEYQCVSGTQTVSTTSNETTNGTTTYIQSPGYPNASIPNITEGICSVTASCDTPIRVTPLHLELHDCGTGTCEQYVEITDGTKVEVINSSRNTFFNETTIYTSNSHFILLKFKSQRIIDSGLFWLQFTGVNYHALTDLRCNENALKTSPTVPKCLATTTATSTSTSVSATTQAPLPESSLGTAGTVALAVCLVLLVCLVAAALIFCFYKKNHRKGKMKVSANNNVLPDQRFAHALGLNKPLETSAPPRSTYRAYPRRLEPI